MKNIYTDKGSAQVPKKAAMSSGSDLPSPMDEDERRPDRSVSPAMQRQGRHARRDSARRH